MSQLPIIRYVLITMILIAMTACATSPWNQEQADAHLNIGNAYIGEERFNEAIKELLQAESLAPDDPKVHYYLGIAYYRKGIKDKAMDKFKKALSFKSDYSEAHNFLGYVYLEMELWDNAIDSFKNALANILYETPDKALFNMGMAYQGKGDYQNALKTYEDAKNRKPNTVPLPLIDFQIGMTYYAKGDLEKAVQYFKTALKTAPSLLEAHYWLGQCYIKQNVLEKAKTEFKIIIEITPETGLGIAAKRSLDSLSPGR